MSSAIGRDLYEQGRTALAEHRVEDAASLLDRAARACPPDDHGLGLRIKLSQAWVVFERRGLLPALDCVSAVRTEASRLGIPDVVASAQVQTGVLHARAGDLDQAWQSLAGVEAEALEPPDRMRMLMNRGTIASQVRHWDEAAADLRGAAELADDLGVAPLAFMARHNLGWVQFVRGDLPAALREMLDAEALDVELDRSVARLDLARVLLEAGLVVEARDLLLQARQHQPAGQQAAEVDVDLARCELLLGDPEAAWSRARDAAAEFSRRGEPVWWRRATLLVLRARPTLDAALELREQALAASDELVAQQAGVVALLAGAAAAGDDATELLADATALSRAPTISLRLTGLLARARAAAEAGDEDLAAAELRMANTTLLRAQLGLASLDLRTATAIHARAAAALDLDLASRRGPLALLEASERWRAALRPAPHLRPSPDPRVAAAATELRRLRSEAEPGSAASLRAVQEAERELRALTWGASAEIPATATTLSASELRRAASEAGVSLVITIQRGEQVSAVVLAEGPTRHVDLGPAALLSEAVEAVRADMAARARLPAGHPLAAAVRASLTARLEELSRATVVPLGVLEPRVVVVPTLVLSGVPWPALPGLAGRAVTVAPTASSWACMGRVVDRPRVSVLTGPGLPAADTERTAVGRSWALERAGGLLEAIARDDLVHVIAHGEHRGDNPLFSSLLLDDGRVVAHELEGLDLRASHVVLSACEVGRTTHRPGDQPLGLTAMLLSAGVTNVVAPVAPVGDVAAARVMGAYHAELRTGLEPAEALARACEDADEPTAFVSFGAPWRAVVDE